MDNLLSRHLSVTAALSSHPGVLEEREADGNFSTSYKMARIPPRYAPASLGPRQQRLQRRAILRSRRAYKRGKYVNRPRRNTFKSKPSGHVARATKMYKLPMRPTRKLARATGCSVTGLKKIVNKGEGAFYSSGSRPNQTAASWARARLASTLTGGPASRVDFKILEAHCKKKVARSY